MELRPPRWIVAVMAAVAVGLLAAAVTVAVAALAGGPWGLWVGSVLLLVGALTAGRIAVVGTRSVVVGGGRVVVTGVGSHDFEGDRLVGPLEQLLLGVRLTDGSTTRRVFAQLPNLTSALVARLPEWHPQLRAPVEFPVVLPGRIGAPIAYGIVASIGAFMGGWATVAGVGGPGPDGPNRVVLLVIGPVFLVGGVSTLWWVTRRAERRVEIHADRIERVVLLGRRRSPVSAFAAAVVVRSARTLPKSTLQREVHHLRRLGRDGSAVEAAPLLAAFPEYGEAEGRLMDDRAGRLHRLHGVPRRSVEIHRTSVGELALWDHGESSPGAHRHTLVLPFPVAGERVVPLLHGRVAVGGSVGDAVLSYDDRMLVLLDLRQRTVRHVAVETSIRSLEPGYRRVVTVDGPLDVHDLADAATPGWPSRWGPLGVPNTPWLPGLERALAELERFDDPRRAAAAALLLARAHESLVELLREPDDEPSTALLAPVLELARFDDPYPLVSCSGAGRSTVLGPDGRPECRGCGVATTMSVMGDHGRAVRSPECDGSMRAPAQRAGDVLRGSCPACGLDGPLTYDGLVRHHRPSERPYDRRSDRRRAELAQNIYDDPDCFDAYARLRRSVDGLDGAPEWSDLRSLLPPVVGARVVDLGCGYGWFCRWAAASGAASVLGVDVSERMLERARGSTDDPAVTYRLADLERLDLDAGSYDVAYSSLALHDVADLDRLLANVASSLVPGASFACSVEHPIFTAPRHQQFVDGPGGTTVWPLDAYFEEGARVRNWLAPGVVKHHRTTATYVTVLQRAGLQPTHLVDWAPTDAHLAEFPEWVVERERPAFLLLAARRIA